MSVQDCRFCGHRPTLFTDENAAVGPPPKEVFKTRLSDALFLLSITSTTASPISINPERPLTPQIKKKTP